VLLEFLCCTEWIDPKDKRRGNKVMVALDSADPTYRRARLYEDRFAQVREVAEGLARVRGSLGTPDVSAAMSDPQGFASKLRSAFRGEDW
jgi:hypothetical protein